MQGRMELFTEGKERKTDLAADVSMKNSHTSIV
jgi:hypothetical protein